MRIEVCLTESPCFSDACLFFFLFWSIPTASIHTQKNCVPLITPSPFYAIFFPASISTLLHPLLLRSGCYDNSSTAAFIYWRPRLLFFFCRESAPLTSIHNSLRANAVTESKQELTSLCARWKTPCVVWLALFLFFFTCVFFFGDGTGLGHLSSPPGGFCHHRVFTSVSLSFPSDTVTVTFLLAFSSLYPLPPPPPPPLTLPVTAISAWLRIICCACTEASPLKPVEISSADREELFPSSALILFFTALFFVI